VQRIQRFGDFNEVKRSALERIAGSVLKQNASFAELHLARGSSGYLDSGDPRGQGGREAAPSGGLTPISEEAGSASSRQQSGASGEIVPAAPAQAAALAASGQGAAASAHAASPNVQQCYGLIEHMMLSDGTVRTVPFHCKNTYDDCTLLHVRKHLHAGSQGMHQLMC
jgi:hypothetical protein